MTGQKLTPSQVQYLVFQGGGGKGYAYLGALDVLKTNSKLPMFDTTANSITTNGIIGIAGASAGAITSFLVAMGRDADYIQTQLSGVNLIDSSQLYEAWSLSASDGSISRSNQAVVQRTFPQTLSDFGSAVEALMDSTPVGAATVAALETLLSSLTSVGVKSLLNVQSSAWSQVDCSQAIACLWCDFGVCSGTALREFLMTQLTQLQLDLGVAAPQSVETMTIKQFNALTGVKFVVSGTNVTSGISLLFNENFPPNLPVVDAVAISASFPGIFKPTWLDTSVFGNASTPQMPSLGLLEGYWADGGIMNNFPLHAFDAFVASAPSSSTYPPQAVNVDAAQLNPSVLGFQLVQGSGAPVFSAPSPDYWNLTNYSGAVFSAMLAMNSDGNIRSLAEKAQTIQVPCGNLGVSDFSASAADINAARTLGSQATSNYFSSL